MKKLLYLVFIFIVLCTNVSASEKPTLYFFMSTGCGYCTNAIEELNNLEGMYNDVFEIVIYDVNLDENYSLYTYAADLFELDYYIPMFVVGDDFAQIGYSEEILTNAVDQATNSNYTDVLASIIKENSDIYTSYTLKEACEVKEITYYNSEDEEVFDEENIIYEQVEIIDETNDDSLDENFNYITIVVGTVLIGAFALVIFKFN